MSDVVTNLKVRFGADTRQFKKGTYEGKRAMKQFTGDASNNMNKFAGVFGVNMGAISQNMRSFKAGTTMMGGGFKGAAKSSNIFTGALKFLKVAMISTGIGALVVAFGSLVAYFTKTERGANALSKIMAGFKAVVGVITDRFSALGEKVFWAFSHPKEAIIGLWETLKTNVINRITGIVDVFTGLGKVIGNAFKLDWDGVKKAAGETGTALAQVLTGLDGEQQKKVADGIIGITQELKKEVTAASQLDEAQKKLERREISLIESYAKRRAEIDKLRLAAKDETRSAEERRAALLKAATVEKSILDDQMKLQKEKVRILAAQQALGENMTEDNRELAEEQAKVYQLESAYLKSIKKLKTEQNTLDKEIATKAAALAKKKASANSEIEKSEIRLSVIQAARRKEIELLKLSTDDESKSEEARSIILQRVASLELSILKDQISLQKQKVKALQDVAAAGKQIDDGKALAAEQVKLSELETSYATTMHNIAKQSRQVGKEMQDVFIDFGSILNESMQGFAVGFGENIGQLLAGADNVTSFSNLVAGALADMAITVGKIAIGTGIAVLGIKKALMSMNPVAAIAGGIALVALGTWAKSSLASAAEGGGYGGNAGALSGNIDTTKNSNSNIERSSQAVNVTVSGDLKLKNNVLVAAIDSENRRKGIVT